MNNHSENKPIDIEFLKKIIGDDNGFKKELFEIFLDSSKYNVAKLESALKSEDNNSWYMATHALKGSSASIGAFKLSKVLEYAQKISDSDSEAKIKALEDIKIEFMLVEEFILNDIKSMNNSN